MTYELDDNEVQRIEYASKRLADDTSCGARDDMAG